MKKRKNVAVRKASPPLWRRTLRDAIGGMCDGAMKFLRTRSSFAHAWRTCTHPAWMLWAVEQTYHLNAISACRNAAGVVLWYTETSVIDKDHCDLIRKRWPAADLWPDIRAKAAKENAL